MATSETYTIGKVVKRLQASFPDLTVSKVRFLESEGLVKPQRTKSGYRAYTEGDVKRLETVLRLQQTVLLPAPGHQGEARRRRRRRGTP